MKRHPHKLKLRQETIRVLVADLDLVAGGAQPRDTHVEMCTTVTPKPGVPS